MNLWGAVTCSEGRVYASESTFEGGNFTLAFVFSIFVMVYGAVVRLRRVFLHHARESREGRRGEERSGIAAGVKGGERSCRGG